MVVEHGSGRRLGEAFAQLREIGRVARIDLHDDHARRRQLGEIETLAQPRREQSLRLLLGVSARLSHAVGGDNSASRGRDVGLEVMTVEGLHLHGDLARELLAPIGAGVEDEQGRAGGERGEKCRDRDDDHERAARNRIGRRQRLLRRRRLIRAGGAGAARVFGSRSLIDMQPPLGQHETARRLVLVHEIEVMRRDHDRRAGFVQLHEEAQQAAREGRIDIARRLVGDEQLGTPDDRARNRRALLFPAREHARRAVAPLEETNPAQKLEDLGAIGGLLAPQDAQGKRDIPYSVRWSSRRKS